MKTIAKIVCSSLLVLGLLIPSTEAFARTPSLSLNQEGSGTARLVVSGADPYAQVTLYQRSQGSDLWTIVTNFGNTDGGGYFSGVVGMSTNNTSSEYYVTVNGYQSTIQRTYSNYNNNNCNYYYSCSGSVSISQSSVSLSVGQSTTVTLSGSSSYYVSSNTNSSIVTTSISGNSLYLYGSQAGSSTVTVCSNQYSGCVNVYVTVSGGNYYGGSISFSQSNVNVSLYQSTTVSIYGGNSSYYVSSNSNSYVVDASISGSSLYLYAKNNGSSTLSVCSYNNAQCGSVYVTVGGGSSNTGVSFSESNPTLGMGQNRTIAINSNNYYGGYYYISSNTNVTVIDATISGSNVMLYGKNNGSSTVTVCQSSNGCGSLYVSVTGNNQYYPYNPFGNVYGISSYKNGTLLSEGGTVYIVYKNTKTGFANKQAFEGLGFKWGNVASASGTGIVQSSYTVTSPYMAHPWGTWIKWGNTVYFIHENGLVPVPTYDTFTNNGGEDRFVVPANVYDTTLPVLQNMTYGDSRLR
jgi:hypothetical protein